MSITFETLSVDDLSAMHDLHWTLALEALEMEQVEGPVSEVMPYHIHLLAYEGHVEGCTACQEDWMNQCPTGDSLSSIAADAMSRQDKLAELN